MRRAVLPLALALALLAGAGGAPPEIPQPEGGAREAGARKPGKLERGSPTPRPRTDGAAPEPPRRDPDQEVIDHLDELRDLELLENLELFDAEGDERK